MKTMNLRGNTEYQADARPLRAYNTHTGRMHASMTGTGFELTILVFERAKTSGHCDKSHKN
jgi:hypothetical protein